MNIAFAGFRHSHIMVLYNMALNAEDVHITGCFEEDDKARESAVKDWGISFTYDSYEALLDDVEVEAVAIGDYYQKRGAMVIAALKKGKHVMCDKPICTDLDELEEYVFCDEDDDFCDCCDCEDDELYEVECPSCGEEIYLDDEMLDEEFIECPACGEKLELDIEFDDCDCDCGCCDCDEE